LKARQLFAGEQPKADHCDQALETGRAPHVIEGRRHYFIAIQQEIEQLQIPLVGRKARVLDDGDCIVQYLGAESVEGDVVNASEMFPISLSEWHCRDLTRRDCAE
jgi:hypothetical protein